MLKEILKTMNTKINELKEDISSVDDKVVVAVNNTIGSIESKFSLVVDSTIDEVKKLVASEVEKITNMSKMILSYMEEMEKLKSEILELKNDFDFTDINDWVDVAEEVGAMALDEYLKYLKAEKPELFSNRSELTQHMEQMIQKKPNWGNWYTVWKTVR